jgi:hypothetical protein
MKTLHAIWDGLAKPPAGYWMSGFCFIDGMTNIGEGAYWYGLLGIFLSCFILWAARNKQIESENEIRRELTEEYGHIAEARDTYRKNWIGATESNAQYAKETQKSFEIMKVSQELTMDAARKLQVERDALQSRLDEAGHVLALALDALEGARYNINPIRCCTADIEKEVDVSIGNIRAFLAKLGEKA